MSPQHPYSDDLPSATVRLIRYLLARDTPEADVLEIVAHGGPERRQAIEREVAKQANERRAMRN